MRANSRSNHPVLVGILCALAACGNVDGGAVELSWKLRPASSALEDKFVNCRSDQDGTGTVTAVRLDWAVDVVVNGAVEQQVDQEEWPCGDSHGVTGFVLPEGSGLFSITPLCEFGPADPATFVAPAVEQRQVIVGDTVSLGALELIVQVSDCSVQACICQ
jgi:hypothetical protein